MFENEIAINETQLGLFAKIANDVPEETLYRPSEGHGHPPIWILGHLAIVGEIGQRMLGGSISHPEWIPLFGLGSSDIISQNDAFSMNSLTTIVTENYRARRDLAAAADEKSISRLHGVELFARTPIKTVGNLVALIMTNHFGFHLSQLSSCRRSAGHGPLF